VVLVDDDLRRESGRTRLFIGTEQLPFVAGNQANLGAVGITVIEFRILRPKPHGLAKGPEIGMSGLRSQLSGRHLQVSPNDRIQTGRIGVRVCLGGCEYRVTVLRHGNLLVATAKIVRPSQRMPQARRSVKRFSVCRTAFPLTMFRQLGYEMRNFIDLIDNGGADLSKPGGLRSYLMEAQDYTTILNPVRKLYPELSKRYDREIDEIRRVMKRVDRIVWFLRLWRMNVVWREYNLSNPKLNKDVLANFAADYKKHVGPVEFADISEVMERLIPQFRHFLSLPIADIQNLRFVGQTPNSILDTFKAAEETYNEKQRDEGNPRRWINHAKPTSRYGSPHNCSRCGIDARRPETWGNCAALEKTAIDFGAGLRWVILDSVACAREAEAMIHCGNEGAPATGDRILSLRQAETKDGMVVDVPHLTFILHSNGDLGEMKAPENNRPGKRWHKQILRLILSPMVTGLRGGNYLTHHDFATDQLSPQDFETLLKQKPDVLELPVLWKLVSEKKVAFTPAIARRIAKADDKVIGYAYKNMPWNRETIGAFISGEPGLNWIVPMVTKLVPSVMVNEAQTQEEQVRAAFAEHPELFGILGEQNLLPLIGTLGAARFSEQSLANITVEQAVKITHSRDDMLRLPEAMRNDPNFVKAITGITYFRGSSPSYGINLPAVAWLSEEQLATLSGDDLMKVIASSDTFSRIPPKFRDDPEFRYMLVKSHPRAVGYLSSYISDDELHDMMVNMAGRIVSFVPKERLTTELVDAGLNMLGYGELTHVPEEIMSQEARAKYWNGRTANDRTLHLKDVPKEFRSRQVIVLTLSHHEGDIKDFVSILDDDLVVSLLRKTKFTALRHMPDVLKTQAVADLLNEEATKNEGLRHYYKEMPKEFMTRPAMEYLVKSEGIPFANIPEGLRDPQTIIFYLQNNTGRGTDKWREENYPLLQRYVTPEIAKKVVTDSAYAIRNIPPSAITEDVALAAVDHLGKSPHGGPDDWLIKLVKNDAPRAFTRKVVVAMVENGMLPIADIPPRLLTADAVVKRLRVYRHSVAKNEGLKSVPTKLLTEELVIRLIGDNPPIVKQVPMRLRTSNVLEAWLRTFGDRSTTQVSSYHQDYGADRLEIFKMFPKSAWTSAAIAMAMNLHIFPAVVAKVPPALLDAQVKRAILARSPDAFDQLGVEEDDVAVAVGRNIKVLERLSPDQITEPVAYEAMRAFASQGRGQYQEKTRDALLRIPKKVWSKRVWEQAVGYIAPLDHVPDAYVDRDMELAAVRRDPSNIAHVKNPAKWLTDNWDSFHTKDEHFKLLLERGGLVKTKKSFADVRELPREALAGAYTTAEISGGPVNKRAYLFDQDRYVFALYSEKGQIRFLRRSDGSYRTMPDAEKAQTVRALLPLMAKKHFPDFECGDLYLARVFGRSGKYAKLEEELDRKGIVGHLKWSEGTHETGTLYTAWLNDEPIIRIDVGSRGAGMNSGLRDVDVINRQRCMQHIDEIADKVERFGLFWNHELGSLGLRVERAKLVRVAGPLVAKFGNLEVRRSRDGKFLSLFGKKGLIGFGRPTTAGGIRGVTSGSRLDDGDAEVKLGDILEKVSLGLKRGLLTPPET